MAYRKKTEEDLRRDLERLQERYDKLRNEVVQAVEQVEAGAHPNRVLRKLAARVKYGGAGSWTKDQIMAKAWEWAHAYGSTPEADDWSPALAKSNAREPDPEKSQRWLAGDWPSTATVQRKFGSWNAMVDAAQLPRNEPDRSKPKRVAGEMDRLPEWTGWELIPSYRARAGIASAAELARRAGLAFGTVREVEQGRHSNPTIRVILALAHGLGVPPAALLETRTTQEDPHGDDNT